MSVCAVSCTPKHAWAKDARLKRMQASPQYPVPCRSLRHSALSRCGPDVHLGPEQAVQAPQALRGRLLVPIYWGTFSMALHAWTEPVKRLLVAWQRPPGSDARCRGNQRAGYLVGPAKFIHPQHECSAIAQRC